MAASGAPVNLKEVLSVRILISLLLLQLTAEQSLAKMRCQSKLFAGPMLV
jgi:hypothetical protein